ncbi:hypothetical protein [Glutamicibacter sp.]|uniref:hypothetical protein n=1 Tax=Glutamicibacter sp. TaxID=1931995 RepID=UPI0028BF0D74|nr:hypothetical protein [Glutamicibacter sp.]
MGGIEPAAVVGAGAQLDRTVEVIQLLELKVDASARDDSGAALGVLAHLRRRRAPDPHR